MTLSTEFKIECSRWMDDQSTNLKYAFGVSVPGVTDFQALGMAPAGANYASFMLDGTGLPPRASAPSSNVTVVARVIDGMGSFTTFSVRFEPQVHLASTRLLYFTLLLPSKVK